MRNTRMGLVGRIVAIGCLALGSVLMSTSQSHAAVQRQDASPNVLVPNPSIQVGVTGAQMVDVRDAPGGAMIATLPPGVTLTLVGRSSDGEWVLAEQSNGAAGWLALAHIVAFGVEDLPVVEGAAPLPVASAMITQTMPAVSQSGEEAAATPAVPVAAETQVEPLVERSALSITATVNLTDTRLNVRSGPGTGYAILGKAQPAETMAVLARDQNGAWIKVERAGEQRGWVAVAYVTLSVPVMDLPVEDVSTVVSSAPVVQAVQPQSAANQTGAATGLEGVLVFQVENGGAIYRYDLTSGALAELAYGFDPAISPDGSTVAFTRGGGENGLYLIDSDGRNERRIFSGSELLRSPKWSADGQLILFQRAAEGGICRQITLDRCVPEFGAIEDVPMVRETTSVLSRVDRNGESYRDIPSLYGARNPDWADGGIVYQQKEGLEITQDQPDGSSRNLLKWGYAEDPDWQPGGDWIVFQQRQGSHWELYRVRANGEGLESLTRPATVLVDNLPSNVAPAWSPDGQHIVFLSNRTESGEAGAWRLWVMDADGSNQRALPVEIPINYTFTGEQMVSWGPR